MINSALEMLQNKKHIRIIMGLAIPAIIENILQVLMGSVDMYFVGEIGDTAINGVGLTNLIMNMYIAVFAALGIGATALISRSIGSKDKDRAEVVAKHSLVLGVIVGVFFGMINLIFSKKILWIIGARDETLIKYMMPYFYSVAVPSVFLCVMLIASSMLRGSGDTKTPMKVATVVNLVNIALDIILIRGIGSFDGLGILGAGLATTISRLLGVIILLKVMNGKKSLIKLSGKWKYDKGLVKSIIKISIPAATDKLIMRTGQIIYGGLILKIGMDAYTGHNIAGNIEAYSYLPGMGFGVAAATLVGQNLGAEKPEDAKKYGLISYILSTIFMMVVAAVFFIFAPVLAGLFTENEVIIKQVAKVLRIIALFQPMLCVTLVITSALQGAGDTKFPMKLTLVGIWGIRITGVLFFGQYLKMGLVGVWLAYALDITIRGCILFIRFCRGKWTNIEI